VLTLAGSPLFASSHQDAPLAILDPAANTTDVYAFVDQDDSGPKSLVVALGVYPFEEPGIGPNKFNFDDNVLYEIHVALGRDVAAGRATLSYQFEFRSETRKPNTILQNFTGVIQDVGDANQNFVQKVYGHKGRSSLEQENRAGHWHPRSPTRNVISLQAFPRTWIIRDYDRVSQPSA
jgi:Domain of unknown function (DUF4331)